MHEIDYKSDKRGDTFVVARKDAGFWLTQWQFFDHACSLTAPIPYAVRGGRADGEATCEITVDGRPAALKWRTTVEEVHSGGDGASVTVRRRLRVEGSGALDGLSQDVEYRETFDFDLVRPVEWTAKGVIVGSDKAPVQIAVEVRPPSGG